ncbi:hypothetical protein [Leisingera sp. ANG-Vp]|uniref:hypothetical protein n=1 Tax=Leisingera sp. ANG-Vp TaxID=1577896 RepID=UPI00187CF956|nr:hypothetical protein [Leisingera sp. ANG-Vp]
MSEDTVLNIVSAISGTALIGLILWLSLRKPTPRKRNHPSRKRRRERRDNDRNTPPDVF